MKFLDLLSLSGLLLSVISGPEHHVTAGLVHKPLSAPLQSIDTYHAVQQVSLQAQGMESESDSNVRLIPRANTNQHHLEICCLNANILDFYLQEILPHYESSHPTMHQLQADLERVSSDLRAHSCNAKRYHSHHHTVEFHNEFAKMEREQGINKAVGEIDILFTLLQDFCLHKPNASHQV